MSENIFYALLFPFVLPDGRPDRSIYSVNLFPNRRARLVWSLNETRELFPNEFTEFVREDDPRVQSAIKQGKVVNHGSRRMTY